MRAGPMWCAALLTSSLRLAYAQPAGGDLCVAAAATAERSAALPSGLLLAVGRIETGRVSAGGIKPWPWTLDVDGRGAFFPTRQQALAALSALLADGTHSIDAGCFQINLRQHPDAFANAADALDPERNASYAAHFLASLHAREGSWERAVTLYHSAVLARGEPYRHAVYAAWSGTSGSARAVADPDPYVVRVMFFTPPRRAILVLARAARSRLPRIITPG